MQAEAQSKVDKKRDKLERKVLDSQERAFWDVHRPMVSLMSYWMSQLIYLHCRLRVCQNDQFFKEDCFLYSLLASNMALLKGCGV